MFLLSVLSLCSVIFNEVNCVNLECDLLIFTVGNWNFFYQDKNWSMREYLGKGKKIDVACFAENNSKACFNHRTKLQCVFINYN